MEYTEQAAEGQSKAEFVYQALQKNIASGVYAPGTALYIRELSTLLNVSRTPVKEAISRLAFEGYVELLPNRCAIVARISTTEVLELLELREALERSAAFYAAQRRTEADLAEMQRVNERHQTIATENLEELAYWDKLFHMAIAKATYNHALFHALESVFGKLTRVTLPIGRDRAADSIRQHTAIFGAIREGNAEAAQRLMSDHDRDVLASMKAYQYQNIHLFK